MQTYQTLSLPYQPSGILSLMESIRDVTKPTRRADVMDANPKSEIDVQAYYSRIFQAVAAYTTGTGLDPADLTQETFLKAYKYKDSFEGNSSVYTWLFRIARNTCIDAMRKIKRTGGFVISTPFDESINDSISSEPDIEQRESNVLLRKALTKLDDDFRLLIIMKDLQGLQYNEIAEVTELNEGTVKSRLFRARLQLKKELIKLGYTP